MGGAIMCPVCGEIVGGWNNEPLTPCACDVRQGAFLPDPDDALFACDCSDQEATIAQQAAWLEAFRVFVAAWDAFQNHPHYRREDLDAARAAISPEAMGKWGSETTTRH